MNLLRHLLPVALLLVSPWALAADFVVESPDIRDGDTIDARHVFNGFGCKGSNRSPALAWHNPPAGTRSFAVTVHDPDAAGGKGWWHWVVVNIPAKASFLDSGASSVAKAFPPGAVQTRNDFGRAGYAGPCPPAGTTHRYEFTVWALKVDKLKVDANAGGALAAFMLRDHVIGQARITANYGR